MEIKTRIHEVGDSDSIREILLQWKENDPEGYEKNITKINQIKIDFNIDQNISI